MAVNETEFLPGYPLRFSWSSSKYFFNSIGVKSLDQFGRFLQTEGFSNDLIEKIIIAGLRGKNSSMTVETAIELLDQYSAEKGYLEILNLALQALTDAGILDKTAFDQAKQKALAEGQVADKGGADLDIDEFIDRNQRNFCSLCDRMPSEFWELTPAETNLMCECAIERHKYQSKKQALLFAVISNANGGKEGGQPFQISDFYKDEDEPQLSEADYCEAFKHWARSFN